MTDRGGCRLLKKVTTLRSERGAATSINVPNRRDLTDSAERFDLGQSTYLADRRYASSRFAP
jgi:hypothetical protein